MESCEGYTAANRIAAGIRSSHVMTHSHNVIGCSGTRALCFETRGCVKQSKLCQCRLWNWVELVKGVVIVGIAGWCSCSLENVCVNVTSCHVVCRSFACAHIRGARPPNRPHYAPRSTLLRYCASSAGTPNIKCRCRSTMLTLYSALIDRSFRSTTNCYERYEQRRSLDHLAMIWTYTQSCNRATKVLRTHVEERCLSKMLQRFVCRGTIAAFHIRAT